MDPAKKKGGWKEVSEQWLCFFVLCLPYAQSLFFAGMTGVLSFLLLNFLLIFVVARAPAICRIITVCLNAIPSSWTIPSLPRRNGWFAESLCVVMPGPGLATSFQRPPPLFS